MASSPVFVVFTLAMPDLAGIHQALVEDYRESFAIAAGKVLAQPST